MNKYNLKQVSLDDLKKYVILDSSAENNIKNEQQKAFYKEMLSIARKFGYGSLSRKALKNYESILVHAYVTNRNGIDFLEYEIKEKNVKNTTIATTIYKEQLLGEKTVAKKIRKRAAFLLALTSPLTGLLIKSLLPSSIGKKAADDEFMTWFLVFVGANAFFIFELIRNLIKEKKISNILLSLTALEKGLLAAESITKDSSKPRRKKKS